MFHNYNTVKKNLILVSVKLKSQKKNLLLLMLIEYYLFIATF